MSKIIKQTGILCMVLLVAWMLFVGNREAVYGAQANIQFGEEHYAVDRDDTFEVKITIKAEANIGLYQVNLGYDTARMQYIYGAERESGGIITLEGTGFGDEITYNLRFKAIASGEAGITVKSAQIDTTEDTHYTIGTFATVPVQISGQTDNTPSFFDQLLNEKQGQASEDTYGIQTNIPVAGSMKDSSGNVRYVVDLADYDPQVNLWEYKLVTDSYLNKNLTYFSDTTRNVRVLLVMDEAENFSLWAFKKDTQSFFPVNELESGGTKYYIMSVNACVQIPAEMTQDERVSNTIFYAIDENGVGDYYRYTAGGVLEKWEAGNAANDGMNVQKILRIVILCIAAFITLAMILLFVLLLVRKFKRGRHQTKHSGGAARAGGSDKQQYFFVIRELTAREIKRKYARSYLGIMWSVLNPLLMMIVMSLIFSYMFKRSIENFPLYYLTGNIFWTLFNVATNHAMTALVDNKSLLLKAKLPKQTFVLSRVYTSLVNFGYTCIAYVLMLLFFRVKPTWTMLLFPFDVALALMFATGIGYILSILYVFFADIKYLYSVLLTLVMYLSAIFYPVTSLPPFLQKIIGYNPIYLSIYIAREAIVYQHVPHYSAWLKLGIAAFASMGIGLTVFKKKQNDVMQRV